MSGSRKGLSMQLTQAELNAIVETARIYDVKVAAHAHGIDGIRAAMIAGVSSIEHASFLSDEIADEIARFDGYLVPTLTAQHAAGEMARSGKLPRLLAAKALRSEAAAKEGVRYATAKGLPIAFGTDSGISVHGENAGEFELLLDAGMKLEDAIVAATTNAAELPGLAERIGSIEPGKHADIIATRLNPTVDPAAFRNVTFVMRRGVIRREGDAMLPFEDQRLGHQ